MFLWHSNFEWGGGGRLSKRKKKGDLGLTNEQKVERKMKSQTSLVVSFC